MLRALRHWLVAQATDVALFAAPHMSARGPDRVAAVAARLGPHCPVIARIVANNMRAVGVYSPTAHRGYFAQLGGHFAGALHALRLVRQSTDGRMDAELARIAAERVELDPSVARLPWHRSQIGAASGPGAILIGPHIANYLLNLARLNQDLPLTVYLRYSKEARRRAAKERWYRASGVQWISEPSDSGGPLGRLGRMAAALSEGRVLFITPDLPQKRDDGVPVRFFDREIYLPAGPALLAERTGAPLYMLTAAASGRKQRLLVHGPCEVRSRGVQAARRERRGADARRAAVQQRLQWFAAGFERFLTQHPELWYLWGDKRWTRLLAGDPRYGRRLSPR